MVIYNNIADLREHVFIVASIEYMTFLLYIACLNFILNYIKNINVSYRELRILGVGTYFNNGY